MDINAIGQALIDAVNKNDLVQTQAYDQARRNKFTDINNAANATGLLYSTRPGAQQLQVLASDFVPQYAKLQQNTMQTNFDIRDTLKKATDQIAALNNAAAELNSL